MSFITAIGTANPPHRFSQSDIAEFMARTMALGNGDHRRLKTIFRASGIDYRHSVLEDYGRLKDFTFYPEPSASGTFPGTEKRLEVFREHALVLSLHAVQELANSYPQAEIARVTHLIVVCCTGMYAPGLDIDLVNSLGLPTTTQRTAINFMGCYAAFNALKIADAVCSSTRNAKVLVVCTELCSLHFQRTASDDNLLANALFGDGSAAVVVESEPGDKLSLRLESFHNDLAAEGFNDMAWTVGDLGFEMKLSSYVPDLIRKGVSGLIHSLLKKIGADLSEIHHFAIHPGGKKILEVIEDELGIDKRYNDAAYRVLRNFGNMSSPTILFVLKEIISDLGTSSAGHRILGVAFGPGLTLESMILRVEKDV